MEVSNQTGLQRQLQQATMTLTRIAKRLNMGGPFTLSHQKENPESN